MAYENLEQQGIIEFVSTSFIRGTTLDNCIVLVDEMQNLTFHELDSIITRVGKNSRIIFSGDYYQSDLKSSSDKKGILDFMNIMEVMNHFTTVEFGWADIVRSDFVRDYIMTKEMVERGNIKSSAAANMVIGVLIFKAFKDLITGTGVKSILKCKNTFDK